MPQELATLVAIDPDTPFEPVFARISEVGAEVDTLGRSGRAILDPLVAGETDPQSSSRCAAIA
jgi:hypothetical protein